MLKIVKYPFGVGVVAETPWAAFAAKDALDVVWTRTAKAQNFNTDNAFDGHTAVARGTIPNPVEIGEKVGDAPAAFNSAASVIEEVYRCDYAYHAQMEPLNAVASVSPAGDCCGDLVRHPEPSRWPSTPPPMRSASRPARSSCTTC